MTCLWFRIRARGSHEKGLIEAVMNTVLVMDVYEHAHQKAV